MSKADKSAKAAKVDRIITHRAARHRDTWPVRIAGTLSEVADQPPLIALASATIAVGAVLRRPALARTGVRMLAAHLLATGIKTVLKANIDRTRPKKALKDGHHIGKGSGAGNTDLNSFPSGHTAGAVAIAQGVARDRPLSVGLSARAAAVAVAAIQMPRGKHYISDVLAGAAIGWASEVVTSAALRVGERAALAAWARRGRPSWAPE